MPDSSADDKFIQQAVDLARKGIGLASPNPYVGAVITDAEGNLVGSGFHTYDGVKHAEVRALEQAGSRARGGTLYINLEPCSHHGRTPPCAEAVIAAGIQRVVASMADPNPQVSGRGFEMLRSAGVRVEVGSRERQARRLNQAFARYIRAQVPLVTLKSAMSLDGKIAPAPTVNGERIAGVPCGGWITGESARAHVQKLRHQHDAILVGIGTVLADDPLLTDRSGLPRRRPLLRVILDSHLRLPLESRLAASAQEDVLVFCSSADEKKRAQVERVGVRVEQVPSANSSLDFPAILRRLGELEITSLLIEGGSTINASALAANIADKIMLYYAPRFLGEGAVPFSADGSAPFSESLRLKSTHVHRFGEDFAVEGYLRDPYAE